MDVINNFIQEYLPYAWELRDKFGEAIWETLYMLGLTIVFGGLLGLLLGIVITVSGPNGILPNKVIYGALDSFINIFR